LWALDQAASQRRFLLSVVQVILLTIVVSGIRRAPVLHLTIAAFCMAACMADLLDFIVAPGHGMEDDGFTGLHTQKNQTGILLMYGCLATASCLFLVRSRLRRGIFAAVTLIMIGLLIATRSTTSAGVVGCAALGMPVLLAIGRLPRRFRFVIGSTCLLFMAAIAVTYVTWCGVDGSDPLLPLRGATFTDRTDIWSFVAGELAKRPWLGAGYQSFWSIDPALQPSLKTDEWFATAAINQAHNGYLDMLATGGVFGLVGSLLVVGRSIALAWRALSEKLPARLQPDGALAYATAGFHMSFLLGLIVHNFTESNLFNNAALLCVGFLLATLDLEKWRLAVLRTKENQVGDESAKSRFSTADLSLRAGQSRRVKNKPHAC
jgi:O-antigen ligase